MKRYIYIEEHLIDSLNINRLLNIYKINRKYLFQILAENGFDTSNNGNNINWFIVNDVMYFNIDYNKISFLNKKIKEVLNENNK